MYRLMIMLAATLQPIAAAPARGEQPRNLAAGARLVIADYAACVANESPALVRDFLARAPSSAAARKLGDRLAQTRCEHEGSLRFSPILFRGHLYEALYRRDFLSRSATALAAAPAIDYRAGFANAEPAALALDLPRLTYADCVVRVDSAQARALVVSAAASADEAMAFTSLRPALAQCAHAGSQLRFSRTALRGLIAETLYRMTKAAE